MKASKAAFLLFVTTASAACNSNSTGSGSENIPPELKACVEADLPAALAQAKAKNPGVDEAVLRGVTTKLAIGACKAKARL